MDDNYWKTQYQDYWKYANERQKRLGSYLEDLTGLKIEEYGLGSGSTEFIPGSAESNGYSKGDADLKVCGTNIFIEVTGPLLPNVNKEAPLWFRPDKINNAFINRQIHDTFLAHHCPSVDLWRIIHVDNEFLERCCNKEFQVINRTIRGASEKYVEIPATDRCIYSLDFLVGYLIAFKSFRDSEVN